MSCHLEDYPDVLVVKDVMSILRLGRESTYALINAGTIPSIRRGRAIRVPKAGLARFLESASSPEPHRVGR